MCKFTTIILLCITFSLFTVQVTAQNADIDILKSLNSPTPNGLRQYSVFISNTTMAVSLSAPFVMGVVALIEKDDELLKSTLYVGASIVVNGVLTYTLKESVARPRPFVTYPEIIKPYETVRIRSFPSGHTSQAFVTATALSMKYPKWYVIAPSYLWACSVGYSRMNLGVHYPSDVLAGAVLGAGSAYVTYKINNWFWKKHDNKKLIGLQAYTY
jgi:membrane-associated phospholipid phosphatase